MKLVDIMMVLILAAVLAPGAACSQVSTDSEQPVQVGNSETELETASSEVEIDGAADQPEAPAASEDITEPPPVPEGELSVFDAPNDDGSGITVSWSPVAGAAVFDAWVLSISQQRTEGEYTDQRMLPFGQESYTVSFKNLVHGREVSASVAAVVGESTGPASEAVTGVPRGNLFNIRRVNVLIALCLFFGLVLVFVQRAKRGADLFIRRIAGLDAVDEAVGRATEMGRPILYVPGLSNMSDVATIASLNILGPIAEKVATYETKIIVPNRDPIVYTVAREVIRNAFNQAGRPDLFSEDLVFFVTDSQFGYAAAVDGIIVREKPATNFFLGMFWAESLVMAETGAATGAIQIAGTDSVTQLPFFIVSCDYTLIGEELYAASAYLGKEPVLRGTLKAQDFMKIVLLVVAITGIFMVAFDNTWLYTFLGLQ